MQGYIKLYRSLLKWEWYEDINVTRIFIHCLLKANHKKEKWQGVTIEAGSFVTSYEKLAIETGLTVQQVRTVLNKLKSTGEITNKTTSRYSMITVNNWFLFQQDNKQINKQITNNQQTNNKQITTNNNEKNNKNDKKERNICSLSQNSNFFDYDSMFDKNIDKIFNIYEDNCRALAPLKFEKRDRELRQAIKDFLILIDFDFSYFFELCQKANKQVFLLDNKIDLKSLIKNHSRIYSEFYKAKMPDNTEQKKTTADIVASVKARMEKAENDT